MSTSSARPGGKPARARPTETGAARRPVGLREVAGAAGVSTATVSRAINAPETVSPGLRARIAAVIQELGWVPSGAARALATRRTGTIGAVFPALSLGDFARAIDALQDELAASGYTLLLACSRYSLEEQHRQVVKLVERGVDGLVLVGSRRLASIDELLRRQHVPHVDTFVYGSGTAAPCIGPDNRRALVEMTEHLIALGHRRFGLIAQSTVNNDRAEARRDGVLAALAAHGIAMSPGHAMEGHWSIDEGRRLLRRIMATQPRPTAVICGNAPLAVGAVLESQALGIEVPASLSIAGYDDTEIMRELPIPITTIRVASDEVGRRAAELVVRLVEGDEPRGGIEIPFEIVARRSTGPAPGWTVSPGAADVPAGG